MGLIDLPDELLNHIIELYHHDQIEHPAFKRARYTRAAVPNIDNSSVNVKTSWHVPTTLSSVNRHLRKLSINTVALSMRLEEQKSILEALDAGIVRKEDFALPVLFPQGIGQHPRNIQLVKISTDFATFKHPAALFKFALGELSYLFEVATRLRSLILEGVPDDQRFLDQFCSLLESAKRTNHEGALLIQILGPRWTKESMDRVVRAMRTYDDVTKAQDNARYKTFQSRMARAFR